VSDTIYCRRSKGREEGVLWAMILTAYILILLDSFGSSFRFPDSATGTDAAATGGQGTGGGASFGTDADDDDLYA
jgi:hypothetical protein